MEDFSRAEELLKSFGESAALPVPDLGQLPQPDWLFPFCFDVCGYDLMEPQPHYELCHKLENMVGDCSFSGLDRRAMMILLPRGNYKTTIAGEGLPVAVAVRNPNVRTLMTTHKGAVSGKRLGGIKAHFEHNAEFRKRYGPGWKPDPRAGVWSSKAIQITKRTKVLREPTVEVAALGADMTGSHYDLIICDDPVTKDNVTSAEQRDKVYEYIQGLFSLLDPGGVLILIGTRWHPDDAYGRIIKYDADRERRGLPPLFEKYIRSCYDGPNGLFFPGQYGHEQLEELRERLSPAIFAANYLNEPVASSEKVFKPQFRMREAGTFFSGSVSSGYIVADGNQTPVSVTMTWDTAGPRNNTSSDFHGLTIVGTDFDDTWHVMAADQIRGTVSEVVARVAALYMLYKPEALYIESLVFDLWAEKLRDTLGRYNIQPNLVEARHRGIPKEERIAMLEPRWVARKLILFEGLDDLESQIDNFSMKNALAHDDLIDSLAYHHGVTRKASESGRTELPNIVDREALARRQAPTNPFGRRFLTRRRFR